jgi:peptide/nickel transport system permease protein
MIPVMLVVATFAFLLLHIAPGDPAAMILGDMASVEDVERLREEMNLNQPLAVQFVTWLGRVVRGDLGASIYSQNPVLTELASRAQPTAILSIASVLVAVVIGIPTGIIAAVKRGTKVDSFILSVALFGAAIPGFWLGLVMIIYIGANVGWLPTSGFQPLSSGVWNCLRGFILPAIALGFPHSALIIRVTRSTMLDVLNADYVRTARSKGLSRSNVIGKHALRNALISILTVVGMSFATMVAGTAVTESVFSIPGMGRLVVTSVLRRDYPLLQGSILIIASIYVIANLLVDLAYVLIDPRVKY